MNNKGQILDTMTALTIGQRKMLKEQGVLKGVQLEIEKRMHAFEDRQAEIKSLQEELMYSSTTLRRRRQDGTFEAKKIGEKWFYLSSSL